MSSFADNEYLFTSESVTEGHPDKVADQISDGVLDAVLAGDSNPKKARVACEVLVNTGLAVVSGEIRTDAVLDIQKIARDTIEKIGYFDGREGFSHNSAAVLTPSTRSRPTSPRASTRPSRPRTAPRTTSILRAQATRA